GRRVLRRPGCSARVRGSHARHAAHPQRAARCGRRPGCTRGGGRDGGGSMIMAAERRGESVQLPELIADLAGAAEVPDLAITGIAMHSGEVRPGYLFLACAGTRTSGARYIGEAAKAGAVAALADAAGFDVTVHWPIPVFPVPDLAARAGHIAARFFGHPSRSVTVFGVTGTNGKTSVSHFIAAALDRIAEGGAGLIGTLGWGRAGALAPSGLTTPDAVTLQSLLAGMRALGMRSVAMEVSSHALEQGDRKSTRLHSSH